MSLKERVFPPLNKAPRTGILPPVPSSDRFPKIIHQVFFGNDSRLPEELRANVERIRAMNPGWEHRLYDDAAMSRFVQDHYPPRVFAYFDRIDPQYGAARADFFRYLVVYRCGGIYFDIKSTTTRPLDEVVRPDDRYLLARWRNKPGEPFEGWGIHYELPSLADGEFQQWHVAGVAGHPFLRAVIENILRNIERYNPVVHGTGKRGVLRVTGPIAYTLAITPLLNLHPFRLVDAQEDLGLQYTIYRDYQHKTLFKNHSSNLTIPVVRLGLAQAASARVARGIKRLSRRRDAADAPGVQGRA
jgi:hypothetical protein